MTPSAAIGMLDRLLAANGEDIRLQRLTAGPGGAQIIFEVVCRASVKGVGATELLGGLIQQQSDVILSPTEIDRQGWPGPATSAAAGIADRRIPVKGDRGVIKGRNRNVEFAHGKYIGGELVRIDMRVSG